MTILHSWLTEFVTLDPAVWTPAEVSRVLTDLGLEVEHIDDRGAALQGFVVGFVTAREPHPNADKLSVCTVDVGDGTPRTIVCGAKNVAAGQFVPVALDGAIVPNGGFAIARRKLRGVESQGMICSRAELNLDGDADGIWILATEPSAEYTAGEPLARALGLDDIVYEVAITPNRADALSHVGIARDLAAVTGQPAPVATALAAPDPQRLFPSEVRAPELCSRYLAYRIPDVRVMESPQWLRNRLTAVGLRPRNNIVDVTNYVMMECGQPLHAFDEAQIRGGALVVQTVDQWKGVKGAASAFLTLDSKERTVSGDMLMICDTERPLAIAGVMGGENSEITDATTSVVLESAYFSPTSVRRTAKALGIGTDASYRFERGIDPALTLRAALRVEQLIRATMNDTAFEEVRASADTYAMPAKADAPQVRVRFERMRAVNGIDISNDDITRICTAVGCVIRERDEHSILLDIPSWRADITAEIDLAEEVMRFVGINAIAPAQQAHITYGAATLPESVRAGGKLGLGLRTGVRRALVARGYSDCITNVLSSPDDASMAEGVPVVRLRNALGQETSAMRTSLVPGLLRAAARNLRHGAVGVRLVEFGKVFTPEESERICVLVAGKTDEHWDTKQRDLDAYDVAGDLAAALQSNAVDAWEQAVVHQGPVDMRIVKKYDINFPVYAVELDVRKLSTIVRTFVPVAAYPSMRRDVAFVLDEAIAANTVVDAVRQSAGPLATDVQVFDVFRGQSVGSNKKSVAIAIIFRSPERTLVDREVDEAVANVIRNAERTLGATLRQ